MWARRRGSSGWPSPSRSPWGRPPPERRPPTAAELDDDRVHDLVGERLTLGVPDRPQEAEVAGDRVDDVQEVAADRQAGPDHLPVGLAQQPGLQDLLADRLTGPALANQVPDGEGEAGDVAEHDQ